MSEATMTSVVKADTVAHAVQIMSGENTVRQLEQFGAMIAKSGLLGSNVTASAGAMAAMTMLQENLSPLDFSRKYHLIDGKPSKRSDAMLAEFVNMGGEYEINKFSSEEVSVTFIFKKLKLTVSHTLHEFVDNGVAVGSKGIKTNWKRFPRQMLWARCVSEGIGIVAPQIKYGVYTPEEYSDFDGAKSACEEIVVSQSPLASDDIARRISSMTEVNHSENSEEDVETIDDNKLPDQTDEVAIPEVLLTPETPTQKLVCPGGRYKGTPLIDLDDDTLAAILSQITDDIRQRHPEWTQEILDEAKAILDARREEDRNKEME